MVSTMVSKRCRSSSIHSKVCVKIGFGPPKKRKVVFLQVFLYNLDIHMVPLKETHPERVPFKISHRKVGPIILFPLESHAQADAIELMAKSEEEAENEAKQASRESRMIKGSGRTLICFFL